MMRTQLSGTTAGTRPDQWKPEGMRNGEGVKGNQQDPNFVEF